MMVRECVETKYLTKPMRVKLLDASRDYWLRLGVSDWGLLQMKRKYEKGMLLQNTSGDIIRILDIKINMADANDTKLLMINWGIKKSEMENQQHKKNKSKNREMER